MPILTLESFLPVAQFAQSMTEKKKKTMIKEFRDKQHYLM